jgi:hypothetical protein
MRRKEAVALALVLGSRASVNSEQYRKAFSNLRLFVQGKYPSLAGQLEQPGGVRPLRRMVEAEIATRNAQKDAALLRKAQVFLLWAKVVAPEVVEANEIALGEVDVAERWLGKAIVGPRWLRVLRSFRARARFWIGKPKSDAFADFNKPKSGASIDSYWLEVQQDSMRRQASERYSRERDSRHRETTISRLPGDGGTDPPVKSGTTPRRHSG